MRANTRRTNPASTSKVYASPSYLLLIPEPVLKGEINTGAKLIQRLGSGPVIKLYELRVERRLHPVRAEVKRCIFRSGWCYCS